MKEKFSPKGRIQASSLSWCLRALIQSNTNVKLELARRFGMGITDLEAIEHLMEEPATGPAELSRKLGIKSASVTALLDRLEGMGHLERVPHATDRRKTGLVVTPSAIKTVISHLQPIIAELDEVAEGFSEGERKIISEYLTRVTAVWSKYPAQTRTTKAAP